MVLVERLLDSRKAFLGLLTCYFFLQVVLRLLLPDSLDLDEAEQIFQAQWWLLGYGPQPPLYNWIQQIFVGVFGQSLLALSLLKNLLLLSTWSLVYVLAQRVLGRPRLAALVTLSLVFIPQISWESQRDLSHSVLVTSLAAATLYLGARLLDRPNLQNYVLLGVVVGLGCNAKYSYLLFLAAITISILSFPEARQRLLRPQLLFSVGLALAICMPHWWWLMGNLQLASESTLSKLMRPSAEAFWTLRGQGVLSLITASFQFVVLFLLIFLGFFLRRGNHWHRPQSLLQRLLVRYLLVLAGVFLLFILATGVNFIKDRWMQPLLLLFPLATFLIWNTSARGQRSYAFTALAFMALIPTLLGVRVWAVDRMQSPVRLNLPYAALVEQAFPEGAPAMVISDRVRTAGNIRMQLPDTKVLATERMDLGNWVAPLDGEVWLIWNATGLIEIPADLAEAMSALQPHMRMAGIRYVDIPYEYSSKFRVSFGLALLVPEEF